MKRIRRILFVGLCLLTSLTGVMAQEILLGTTSGVTGDLYQIDPNTGVGTLIGPLIDNGFNPYAVTGLAFDSVNGVLYGSTSNNSGAGGSSSKELVAINPTTGTVTVVGSFTTTGTMADLTFDTTTATLYGTGSLDGNLYVINTTTGAAMAVGSAALGNSTAGNGVAANSAGQIFGSPLGASGSLVQFNKSNGSAATVATLSGAPVSTGAINAMAFNSGGTLYGVNVDNNVGARPTDLVTINTGTGVVTNIGASVAGLDAIVFFNPTAVPEPATLSLLGLGAVGSFGLNVLRRRRRN